MTAADFEVGVEYEYVGVAVTPLTGMWSFQKLENFKQTNLDLDYTWDEVDEYAEDVNEASTSKSSYEKSCNFSK